MGRLFSALFGSKKDSEEKESGRSWEAVNTEDNRDTYPEREIRGYNASPAGNRESEDSYYEETQPDSGSSREMDGYVNFLVGELETVKRAALEKIKEKNAELERKEEQLREKENEITKAKEEIRAKTAEIEKKESELCSKDLKIAEMIKEQEQDALQLVRKEKEMMAKVDSYKEVRMAEVQEELNKLKVEKYDLYQYLVKIRDTQTTMISDYNKMGMLLKELPEQLDTIIDDESIKPEIKNLFKSDAGSDEKAE